MVPSPALPPSKGIDTMVSDTQRASPLLRITLNSEVAGLFSLSILRKFFCTIVLSSGWTILTASSPSNSFSEYSMAD